ncbi:hypothetical protein NBH00_12025 [Paraconexibacter antarcticus]|uniref:Uncharacterized protein n=1 Tax=Paraconexibacter antarcticus TaxID=2949664 RepID=A0ABY5DXZ5_9ACTN|nr:hypothetical protein [Paraconexibacter antarcticus]UTI66908.1 hypothetical protein NBH00_12025 [Paraconexibacter antarcticus]
MSAATTTGVRAATVPVPRHRRRRPATDSMAFDAIFDRPAEGQTLDEFLVGAWEDLSAHRTVTCPVCHAAAMRPRYGAGQGAAGGRCGDCGSVLG